MLTYHRVLPAADPTRLAGVWSATPERFAEQMELLATCCDVVPLSEVPDVAGALGRRVAITFDDGYRDNYEWAFPRVHAHGLPATVFVATGMIDGTAIPWWDELAWLHGGLTAEGAARWRTVEELVYEYWKARPGDTERLIDAVATLSDRPRLLPVDVQDEWMTWDMIRELRDTGWGIEAHTVSHPLLSRLDPERQREEISASADRIGEETGRRPTALAYPVGLPDAFDARSKRAAQAAGMEAAYSLYGGPTTASGARFDPYDIRRIGMEVRHDRDDFAALLSLPQIFGQRAEPTPEESEPTGGLGDSIPSTASSIGNARLSVMARTKRNGARGRRDGRIRTVTLIDRLVHGGAERLAYQLTRDLDPERFDRAMCVTTAGDALHAAAGTEPSAWRDELRDSGVRLIELDRARRSDPRGWGRLVTELRQTDLLHAHMFAPNVCAAVLGRTLGVPVTIAHEHAWAHTGGRHQATIDRHLVARRCDAVIACSVAVRDRMVHQDGLPPDRVVVLPNGIEERGPTQGRDVRKELGIAPGVPVVGSVGALRSVKRFDVLVDAVELVRRQCPDVQVLLVGDGAEHEPLGAQIARLGLKGTIRMLGSRSDVPDVVATFDVAVTSSDAEASPLSVMEYMEAGRAIVSTAVGGVPELIDEGIHGRLVPRRDPAAMATAIVDLLEDPDERGRLGRAAQDRRRAEFGLDVMVGRLQDLYERLYARHRG